MRDSIGNKIRPDDLVNWVIPKDTTRLLAQVVNVQDGGFVDGKGEVMPLIQILLTIPVKVEDFTQEATLQDFFCLRNPKSEVLLDSLSNTQGGAKPS